MLIVGDFKQLEWNTCVFQAQDKVGIRELNSDGVDLHADNQVAFGLPSRLIAKKFLFRLIFGGSAGAYAHDPEFVDVSNKPKFWQEVIDKFYYKYEGVAKWHAALMEEVLRTGKIVLPTGRYYKYSPQQRGGEFVWPRTTILNYPVQGLGADIMVLARVLFHRGMLLNGLQGKLVSTVHDSIAVDAPKDEVDTFSKLFYRTWELIPKAFDKAFGIEYNVICKVEVKVGNNLGDMHTIEER